MSKEERKRGIAARVLAIVLAVLMVCGSCFYLILMIGGKI
jgi:hypothetical protein